MGAAGAIRAGAAYVEVFLEQNALSRSLAATSAKLRGWSAGLGRLGAATRGGELPGPLAAIANFSFSPAGLVTGMLAAVREWASGGAELARLAEKAGTTVEVILSPRLCRPALRGGFRPTRHGHPPHAGCHRRGRPGMPLANKALASIGASVQDLAKLRPEEQFRYLADRIAAVPNPTLRAAAAVKIFGKSGTELLPLLNQGAAGIGRFEQRARELGLVTSTGAAQAALRFSRTLADLTDVLKKCVFVIGSALGPYVEQLTDWITTAAVKVRQWISDHRGLVLVLFKVAGAIVLAGAGFSLFGRILGMVAGGLGMLLSGVRLVGTLVSVAGTVMAAAWTGVTVAVLGLGALFAALATPGPGVRRGAGPRWLRPLRHRCCWHRPAVAQGRLPGSGQGRDGYIRCDRRCPGRRRHQPGSQGAVGRAEIGVAKGRQRPDGDLGRRQRNLHVGLDRLRLLDDRDRDQGVGGAAKLLEFRHDGIDGRLDDLLRLRAIRLGATQNWLSKKWVDFMVTLGQYTPELGEQIKGVLDQDYTAARRKQESESQSKLAGLGKGYEDRQRQIAQDRDAVLGGLDQAKREETDRRHAAYAKQLQASQAAVDAARKELTTPARRPPTSGRRRNGPTGRADYAGKTDFSAMDGMPGAKTSVVGTFSAVAVLGLGYGGGVFVEMKNHLAKISDNGDRLLDEVQAGGTWE